MPLAQQNLTIVETPSKITDGRYPDGNDGSSATLNTSAVPNFVQKQGGFTVPLASYKTYTGGGTLVYSLQSGTLIGDWALNTSTGVFSGTTVGGPSSFIFHISDGTKNATYNAFLVESITAPTDTDILGPTTPMGFEATNITNTQIDVKVDPSADVPYLAQDCKGMKEMRFLINSSLDGVAPISAGMSLPFTVAETPIFGPQRKPSGHVVSIPMFEAIGGGRIVPAVGQGKFGEEPGFNFGSIPGGSTGARSGLSRTADGPASPGVVMITQLYSWRELEPIQGGYDFRRIADDLKQCHALGVYLCVQLMTRTFNGSGGTGADNPAPDYLGGTTTPSSAQPYCTYYTPSNGGYQMWRHDTFVKQRFLALATALAGQFDKTTGEYVHYAGICTQETANNMSAAEQAAAGYTVVKYLAGLKGEVDSIKNTHSFGSHYAMYNFAADNANDTTDMKPGTMLDQYVDYLAVRSSVLMGPDILPRNSGLVNTVYPRYKQAEARNIKACSMQNTSFESADSLTYTSQWGRDNLGLTQIWWFWKRGGAAAFFEHGTDKAIDVIAADQNATPSRIPFGPFNAGALAQTGVDYVVSSYGAGFSTYNGAHNQYTSGRAQPSGGDFFFSAELNAMTGPSLAGSYAGLCVCDDTGNDSRGVWIFVTANELQVSYRTSTGGLLPIYKKISGVTWSTPTQLKIKRVGNLWTFFYAKNGLAWIPIVGTSGANISLQLTDPVICDAFCASTNYSKVAAHFKSVCLQNLAVVTHSYTGLTAGTTYALTAIGRDNALTPNDSASTPVLSVKTTGGTGITRKWDPGLYVVAASKATTADDASTSFNSDLTKISGMAGVKGIMYTYTWRLLEPVTQGTFDFTVLDRDINRVSSAGKKMAIRIYDHKFSTTAPFGSDTLPDYLLSNTSLFGAGSDGTHSGYWLKKNNAGYTAAIWRANVMDRAIALIQALAAHLDPANGQTLDVSANIAWVEMPVTDLFLATGSDYTDAALVTQLERFMAAAIAAWPHTPVRLVAGTLPGMSALVNNQKAIHGAIGGLDVKGINTTLAKRYFDAQLAWSGTLDGTSVDQRGLMPIIQQVGQGELDGSQYAADGSPYSNTDLQSTLTFLGTNYAAWQILTATGNGNWTSSVQGFLASNPTVVTTRPTGW